MMTLGKHSAAVAVLAAVIVFGTGVGVTLDVARGQAAAPAAAGAALREKAVARVRAAEKVLAVLEQRVQAGEALTPAVLELQGRSMRRLADARIDAADDAAGRVRAAEQYVQQCRDMLAMLERRRGQDVTGFQMAQAECDLADAEYMLAKAQGK